jgi:argininosuccinate lyase
MWEAIFASTTISGTLSRFAEELILFRFLSMFYLTQSSYEYRTVSLDDGFAMGSSMMPQKKNPGSVELIRGRAGRMTGYLTAAFTMMKGLPSGSVFVYSVSFAATTVTSTKTKSFWWHPWT